MCLYLDLRQKTMVGEKLGRDACVGQGIRFVLSIPLDFNCLFIFSLLCGV
jgi:hypothetical protein